MLYYVNIVHISLTTCWTSDHVFLYYMAHKFNLGNIILSLCYSLLYQSHILKCVFISFSPFVVAMVRGCTYLVVLACLVAVHTRGYMLSCDAYCLLNTLFWCQWCQLAVPSGSPLICVWQSQVGTQGAQGKSNPLSLKKEFLFCSCRYLLKTSWDDWFFMAWPMCEVWNG